LATDAPGVQDAFRLGWRLARVYREPPLTRQHSEEDPNPPAHLPGVSELSPYERGRLLIAQIDCDTSEFLKGGNSIGAELARVGKGGAELSGARNMILAHYTDLLVSLTGIDVHLGTALGLGRMLRDAGWAAVILNNLGNAARHLGDLAVARERYEEALGIQREAENAEGIAVALLDFGSAALHEDNLAEAEAQLRQSLVMSRELGTRQWTAYALCQLGAVSRKQGQLERARASLLESMRLAHDLGDLFLILGLLGEMVNLALAGGQLERAASLGGAEMALREKRGIPIPALEQAEREETVARVRAVLGEEAFIQAWEQGAAMSLEEAIAGALGESVQHL
jgi:tetratricopeptide (TPR) repeat protein